MYNLSVSRFPREFESFFDDWFFPAKKAQRADTSFLPACDIAEEDGHYLLAMEVAGIRKDDLNIEVVEDQLVISDRKSTRLNSSH